MNGVGSPRRHRRAAVVAGAGVLVLLLLVVVAAVVVGDRTRNASSSAARWDDFHRSDGMLADPARRTLPSGQDWQLGFAPGPGYGGAEQLRIVGDRLRFDGPGAAYAWTTGDQTPGTASVDFVFEPGSSPQPRSSVGLIVSQESGPTPFGRTGVATNSVHAAFGPDGWSLGIAEGTNLDVIATGRYQLQTDGRTSYRAALRRTAEDTVQVDTPDGRTQPVTDDRIADYWGPSVLIEHYQPVQGFPRDPRPVMTGYRVDDGG